MAWRLSMTRLKKLGRYEYWVATIAVSPAWSSSRARAASGSIQPEPAGTQTAMTLRSNPPARSSSRTATATRSSIVSAVRMPTKTRIGSRTSAWWYARSRSRLVTPAAKSRPQRPIVSHATSDDGLPDTVATVG